MQNKLVPFFLIECCWQTRRNVVCNRLGSTCFSLPTVHVFKFNTINDAEMFDVALIKSERYNKIQQAATKAALCIGYVASRCRKQSNKIIFSQHMMCSVNSVAVHCSSMTWSRSSSSRFMPLFCSSRCSVSAYCVFS